MPRFAERCRQLTEAREAFGWMAGGSVMVQQQAVRDHDQAMRNFFAGTHKRPTWRKAGQHEGFRVVAVKPGDVRRLNRNWGQVKVPKAGAYRAGRRHGSAGLNASSHGPSAGRAGAARPGRGSRG
jgi:putative transposase